MEIQSRSALLSFADKLYIRPYPASEDKYLWQIIGC
jgi:hypothetical protein